MKITRVRIWAWPIYLIVLALGASGCASEPANKNYLSEPNLPIRGRVDRAPTDISATTLGADVLVYGRFRWFENDEERTEYRNSWGFNIWLPYYRFQDEQTGLFVVEKDGTFTWRIPKGSYIFYQIAWFDAWDGRHSLAPKVTFDAATEAQALCLGTLVAKLKRHRDLLGKIWIEGLSVRIDDDCDALSLQFRAKYHDSNFLESKSLMQFDPQMQLPKELDERNKMENIFRAISPGLMTSP